MNLNMKKEKNKQVDLFDYRIKYNAGAEHAELDNYHYYTASSADQAMSFHNNMLNKNNIIVQTISIEKYNRYADRWEDETENISINK